MKATFTYQVTLTIDHDVIRRGVTGTDADDAMKNAIWLYPHASRIEVNYGDGMKVFTKGASNVNAAKSA